MSGSHFDSILARVALNTITDIELIDFAAELLGNGHDSRALRQLAALCGEDREEARFLFGRVLADLRIQAPSRRQSVMILAKAVARDISDGKIDPIQGARAIWDISLLHREEQVSELDPFVYAASEAEERPEDRLFFEEEIRRVARELR